MKVEKNMRKYIVLSSHHIQINEIEVEEWKRYERETMRVRGMIIV